MAAQTQLRAVALQQSYNARLVLDLRELTAGPQERLGVVGENGSGKSTLMRILAGVETPDSGVVTVQGTIGYLPQMPQAAAGTTVSRFLDDALADLRAIEQRINAAAERITHSDSDPQAMDHYAEALAEAELRDIWAAPARLEAALAGLGVAGVDRDSRVDALSGGQLSRIALAALLVRRPEILLLDEPTNHLDEDALDYLQDVLGGWPGIVVAVSHDRVFLDAVCTSILDLDPGREGATAYGGRYTEYVKAKAAERQRWEHDYQDWQEESNRLSGLTRGDAHRIAPNRGPTDRDKFITKFKGHGVDAAVSRRVRHAEQRLKALQDARVPKPPLTLHFSPPDSSLPSAGHVISVRDADVPGRLRVGVMNVAHDTKLLVTGANGAGKSTLLALLAGTVQPDSGTVLVRAGIQVGLLAQRVTWEHPDRTALATFANGRAGDVDEHLSELLAIGILHPRELQTPVGRLSFGQQRRLALAILLADRPHVLLLDEPTDHLSLSLVEELEEAVRQWQGPIVVASHDRWLRGQWRGQQAKIEDGRFVDVSP